MGEGEPAAGDDDPGRGDGRGDRHAGPQHLLLLRHRHARLLPRRDHDAHAQDAHPAAHHLLHHHRSGRGWMLAGEGWGMLAWEGGG